MSKPLTEKEKRAVIAELSWATEMNDRATLDGLIDILPPETLRRYFGDVFHTYGVDDDLN